jgi:hypothetical protein
MEAGCPHRSVQYQRAVRVSFDPDLWPANEEDAPGADSLGGCVLVSRDGTRLHSGKPAVGCEVRVEPPRGIVLTRGLEIRIARLEQAPRADAKYDPCLHLLSENQFPKVAGWRVAERRLTLGTFAIIEDQRHDRL